MILKKLELIHRKIFDLIFPKRCAGCHRPETHLCLECLAKINGADKTENAKGVRAVFDYHDKVIKHTIWQLKYHGIKSLAETFGRALYEAVAEDLSSYKAWRGSEEKFLVIPVPLARTRERTRGFNQAELIAEALVNCDQTNFELGKNILKKIKNTPTQVSLKNREARLKNLLGAFKVKENKLVTGRYIILVDDVSTTGATLNECKKVLKSAGAHSALPLAIASG